MKLRIVDNLLGLLFLIMVTFLAFRYFKDTSKFDVLKEALNFISHILKSVIS